MKNLVLVIVFMFVGVFAFSGNKTIEVIANSNCYEVAFDAMEDALDSGFTNEEVSIIGQHAYCNCASNCAWE